MAFPKYVASGTYYMANASKNMVLGSMVAAGLVAAAAVLDLAVGVPFAGHLVMDILFLVSAGLVIYMAYETYQELA